MKVKSDFVMRDVGGSTILVPTGARVVDLNGILTLNATGKFIWGLLDGTRDTAAVVDAMVARFRVEPDQARQDVDTFVARIKELGLVDERPAP